MQLPAGRVVSLGALLFLSGCGGDSPPANSGTAITGIASAPGRTVLSDFTRPEGALFPSDRYTVRDDAQRTGRRLNLPLPADCEANRSECRDLANLNELDGFNIQPRLSIPFSGPIDPDSVNSNGVFILELDGPGNSGVTKAIGINQAVWDPQSNTLHAQSDQLLKEHTPHVLVVTDTIRDPQGKGIERTAGFGQVLDGVSPAVQGLIHHAAQAADLKPGKLVAASAFTTMSATPVLLKMRDQIEARPAPRPDFRLGPLGVRTVFAGPVESVFEHRQTSTSPGFQLLFRGAGATGVFAFGKFRAASFVGPEGHIPNVPTGSGTPPIYGEYDLHFTVYLPSGAAPAGGWPVVIEGHPLTGDRHNFFGSSAFEELKAAGFAVVAINAPGHGGGEHGSLQFRSGATTVEFPSGGRGFDQNGDGFIGPDEGSRYFGPLRTIFAFRDFNRHTVADLLQVVRMIEGGVDIDDDGIRDLDPQRMYASGHSFGAGHIALLLAVQPKLRAGAISTPAVFSNSWLGANARERLVPGLGARRPSLLNINGGTDFDENIPLRNRPVLVNHVPGAMKLQQYFDRADWGGQAGNPTSFAHLLSPARTLVQMVKGDGISPNPSTSAFARAGRLESRVSFLRWDLLGIADPTGVNRHGYAIRPDSIRQKVTFLASDGTVTNDPDGASPFWETPISLPLPEDVGR